MFLLWMIAAAHGRDNGQYAQTDPAIKRWIESLTDSKGAGCCATSDGFRPEEVEWDVDTGSYRVRINGQWLVVPDGAVIKTPNRIGYAIVWYWTDGGKINIRCFLPGTGA
jgi:hypothetical protein